MKIIRLLGLAALGLWAMPTLAQPGGPMQGGRPMRGGMGGPMRSAKMRLPRLVESAAHLSGATALSKSQAKKMVNLIAPWKKRPTMSEDAGKTLFMSLSGTLTSSQKAAMEKDRPRFGGGGRGPGGREGGMGGGGRGQGGMGGRPDGRMGGGNPGGGMGRPTQAQMDKMRSMMASYNPFYMGTPAGFASLPDPMKKGMQRRRDRISATLSQLQQKAR